MGSRSASGLPRTGTETGEVEGEEGGPRTPEDGGVAADGEVEGEEVSQCTHVKFCILWNYF